MVRRRQWHALLWVKPSIRKPRLYALLSLLVAANLAARVHARDAPSYGMQVLPVDFRAPLSDLATLRATTKDVFGTDDAAKPILPFDSVVQTLVLDAADLYSAYSFSFQTEPLRNVSDYTIEIACSNHAVLEHEQVVLGPPVLMENNRANFTASMAFDRAVGETDVTITFRRKDHSVYARITVHYIVCGISFFHLDKETGTKSLVLNNEYTVPDSKNLVHDNLLVFYCFIQYADGSTSESVGKDVRKLPDIASMQVDVEKNELLSTHSFDTCLVDHAVKHSNTTVTLDENCSFGFTPVTNTRGPYYVVRVLKHRVGVTAFHFRWDDFLRGSSFEETFETSLVIRVSGVVAPSVISVTPTGPFKKAGGQLIHFAVVNANRDHDYRLSIGNETLPSVMVRNSTEGWTVLSFVTPKGEGKNIPWDLQYSTKGSSAWHSSSWGGELQRFLFSYLAEDITILSMTPDFGPVRGGVSITCKGHFGKFNLAKNSGDAFMLGSYELDSKFIISVTETVLVFKLPPLSVSQSPSFHVECYIIAGGIRSNTVGFTYESLTETTIDITGASHDEQKDTHYIPMCGSGKSSTTASLVTLFANVNKGAPVESLTFEWHVVVQSSRAEIMKVSGKKEAQSISVAVSKLSLSERYEAIVVVSDARYSSEVTSSIRIELNANKMLGIALSLDDTRSIALPQVDARITAVVNDMGGCRGKGKTLTYDWTYRQVTKSLSPSSSTTEVESPSPRRLGREYIIPRDKLKYGKHKVTVKAYFTEEPGIYGTASAWFNVQPAVLQATIGSGESLVRASRMSDLVMDASLSHDPDEALVQVRTPLEFKWSCEMSTEGGATFALVSECPRDLLPTRDQQKFTVSKGTLRSVRSAAGSTFVRYTLHIQKAYPGIGVRSSPHVSQIVEILESDDTLALPALLSVSNGDGSYLPLRDVPFYEPLVISATSAAGTSWRFQMVEPSEDSFTFLKNPANLLTSPGFYSTTEVKAGRRSLGIREGALKAGTEYTFEIEYESREADSARAVEVAIRTMPKPTVSFSLLTPSEGTTQTTFSVLAAATTETALFKFFFHIELDDGSEMCIDGCSGHRRVSFRVPVVGSHTLRCTMVDARGRYIVAAAEQTEIITIVDSTVDSPAVAKQSGSLRESFSLGDHSTFELQSLRLALYAQKVSPNDKLGSEMAAELVSEAVTNLSHLYQNTQPNTALARDYMLIASKFISLPPGHEALSGVGTFYSLCRMVFHTVNNTPLTERYDMTALLTRALWQLSAHARQLRSGGSSRGRLVVRQSKEEEDEVNEELLEVSELVVPLTARVMSRAEPCGFVGSEKVGEGETVNVAVLCSKEQGLQLKGKHSTMEWCADVFGEDGAKRVMFALGESADYISESGVLGKRSTITRTESADEKSVAVQTRNMASHGFVLSKTLMVEADGAGTQAGRTAGASKHGPIDEMRAADVVSRGKGEAACFTLEQDLRATADIFTTFEEVSCRTAAAVEYNDRKQFGHALGASAYTERDIGTTRVSWRTNGAKDEQREGRTSTVLQRVSGRTFGVKRGQCRDLRPELFGLIVGVWLPAVAVATAICAAVLLGAVGTQAVMRRERARMWADGADGPYIERDVYGRDVGGFTERLELPDDDGEEVVFENPTPRAGGASMRASDGREVAGLFKEAPATGV